MYLGSYEFQDKKKQLESALMSAPEIEFLKMIWAANALSNGQVSDAAKFLNFKSECEDQNPGAKFYFGGWELETLLNEYLSGPFHKDTSIRLNCGEWKAFAYVLNLLRDVENLESVSDHLDEEILAAIQRLVWRQFPWQRGFVNHANMYRFWFLYSTLEAKALMRAKIGLSFEDITKIGFAIFAATADHYAVDENLGFEQIDIENYKRDRFLKYFSRPLAASKISSMTLRKGEGLVAYKPSILRKFPLIKIQEQGQKKHFLPLPQLLMYRITEGLFFDLVGDGKVSAVSGKQFEILTLDVMSHYFDSNYAVRPEVSYNNRHSPDILVFDKSDRLELIVECKARKMVTAQIAI